MRLAISNIAWDAVEDETIAASLRRVGVDAIDVAPSKYFTDFAKASDEEIAGVKKWWSERGIAITGMQSLLFGTTGLNVFGSDESREAMLQHLSAVCRIGAGLGATRLVFGSPKNRDRGELSDREVAAIAIPFFRRVGDVAQQYDVMICLEPNPPRYGANFMTSCAETAQVVEQVAHPSIRMQFDTGALAINGEDPFSVLQDCSTLIGHIHASEPDLLPLGDGTTDHSSMSAAVRKYLPNHVVSIEMLATKHEAHVLSIDRALQAAIAHYRNSEVGETA
jgi:D-psicose/D-tagatose/L-ribulose 3-epimerase